jgi:hypothetical protein
LPGRSGWILGGSRNFVTRRGIDAAIAEKRSVQLSVSGLDLAAQHGGMSKIEAIFRFLARRREQGALQVVTQALMAIRLTGDRQSTPSHSILRPAA